jgi:transcriptional regulator with XRE-family HTH domain
MSLVKGSLIIGCLIIDIYLYLGMTLEEKIGQRLKHFRKTKTKLSAEGFAYENDIARTQYQGYEGGKSLIRIDTLKKICDALNISLEEFFKGIN